MIPTTVAVLQIIVPVILIARLFEARGLQPGGVLAVALHNTPEHLVATIAGWNIPHYFPEYKTIKRGIGGSLISEATYWADRLVIPFKPSTVVFYSGDNDLGYGMTAEMVANDFEAFVRKIHTALPDTHIVIFSIRPSIARWAVHEGVFDANKRIQAFASKNPKLHFVDMTPLLLGADGQPARELLDDDLHHVNAAGFEKTTAKSKPVIAEAEAAYWRGRKTAGISK